MKAAESNQFLPQTAAALRRMQAKVDRLDGSLVQQDIAARRQEALIGHEFATQYDRIEAALKATGSNLNLDQWCKQNIGCDISTLRRRKRLYKHWKEYETKRLALGACGQTGLLFALSLVSEEAAASSNEIAMNRQALPVRSISKTNKAKLLSFDASRCQFITGDAGIELRKMKAGSVNVILTSPPYWPTKRLYGGKGIGFENTLAEYISNLVTIFKESRRVLRDDGILWIVIDDSYKDGDLLFIPSRLAMALQDDGWICRSEIVWSKDAAGRSEPVMNRTTKNHEKVLMFTKKKEWLLF